MQKLILAVTTSTLMVGCATNWSHTSADQSKFRADMNQCDMYSQAVVPNTSSAYNPYLTPGQQAGQSASNAGSQLGRVFELRSQFNNCMYSKGYTKK